MRGQLYQRGKPGGSWTVRVYLGRDPATGKERHKWTTFRMRREAERHLHKTLATLEGGGTVATTRQRLGEYLADWIRGHAPHLAPTTEASYRETIRLHLDPAFGHVPLTKLGPQAVKDYIATKLQTLSPKSVAYHRMILRRALEDALHEGLVARNPVSLVPAPPKRRREMRVLDAEQVRLFLGEARRSSPHYRLYLAALATGARQGELLGLRWKDLDLVTGRAAIQQTFYRLGAQQLFKAPKTGTSRRSVPLSPELVGELLRGQDEQREQKRRLGDRYQDLDLVFCQRNGKPLHAHNVVRRDFHKVLERAKLPRIRFHDLRHTAATLHLQAGTHPKIVAGLLGHASVGVTLDVYSHAIPALAEEAVRDLAATLGGGELMPGNKPCWLEASTGGEWNGTQPGHD